MSGDQAIEWILKAVMGLVSLFVFLLGRDLKRSETAIQDRAVWLQALMEEKATAFDRLIEERFADRDRRLNAIQGTMEARFDRAGQKTSDEANRIMAKMNEFEHRLTLLERDRR